MGHLEFGAAFSRVFDLYGRYAAPLLIWSAAVQFIVAAVTALLLTTVLTTAGAGGVMLSFALVGAIAVVGSAILTGSYIVGLEEAERTGSFPAFGATWMRVTPRLGGLILTSILAGLGIGLGMLLLLVPGLVLLTWWAVFAPVVMLEGRTGTDALGRSRELVRGHGWTVFGLVVVVAILTWIVGSVLGGIVGAVLGGGDTLLGVFGSSFVSNTLVAPVSALVAIVIYQALVGGGSEGPRQADPNLHGTPPPAAPDTRLPPADQPPSHQPPAQQPPTPPDDGRSGPFV